MDGEIVIDDTALDADAEGVLLWNGIWPHLGGSGVVGEMGGFDERGDGLCCLGPPSPAAAAPLGARVAARVGDLMGGDETAAFAAVVLSVGRRPVVEDADVERF